MTLANVGYPVYGLWLYYFQTPLYDLSFQSFDFERRWGRLFQKRVMRTKFDIYVFITWRVDM